MPQPYFYAGSLSNSVMSGDVRSQAYNGTYSYYFLPYSDTQKVVIQWGCLNQTSGVSPASVTFRIAHALQPVVFFTQWDQYTVYSWMGAVTAISNTAFTVDSFPGSSNKPAFSWVSIGIFNG